MGDEVKNVVIQMKLKDAISAETAKITAALKSMKTAADSINKSGGNILSGFGSIGGLAGLASIAGVVEGIKKAMTLAREAQAVDDHLSVALNGNVKQFNQIADLAERIASKTVYSAESLKNAAERLLERGVSIDKIPESLQVVGDVAAALHEPLDSVADQIAQTFGGTIPKALGHAIPALHNLTKESLESGGALELLGKRFNGRAIEEAMTPSGKALKATKDIEQAWRDVGLAIIPIGQAILPGLAKELEKFAMPFKADSVVGWLDVLKEATAQINGDLSFILQVALTGIGKVLNLGLDTLDIGAQHVRLWAVDLVEFVIASVLKGVRTVAHTIDDLSSHLPGWAGQRTNLTAYVDIATNTSDKAFAPVVEQASAAAKAATRKFADDFSSAIPDTIAAASAARDTTIADVEDRLGYGKDVNKKQADLDAAKHAAEAASAAKKRIQDAADEKDALASLFNVRQELESGKHSEGVGSADSAALEQLKAAYDARALTLEQYYGRRAVLENAASDKEIQHVGEQITLLGVKAAKEKLAGEPATDTLMAVHDLLLKLVPLEDARAARAAKLLDEEQKALAVRKEMAATLERENNVRALHATAAINGRDVSGSLDTANASILEQQIAQQQELNALKEKGANATQLEQRAAVQGLETKAEQIKIAQQLGDAAEQQIKAMGTSAEQGAHEVDAGRMTPDELRDKIATEAKAIDKSLPTTFSWFDHFFSAEDAANWKERLKGAFADAKAQAKAAADSVTPFIADLEAIGSVARKSLENGVASNLTDVELRAKSASQALKDLGQALLKDILDVANHRLVSSIADGIFGSEGKGGGAGKPGLLTGVLSTLLGGGGKNPTGGGVQAPEVAGAGGSVVSSTPGGGGFSLGSMFSGLGKNVSGAWSSLGNMFGGLASGVGNVAAGAASGVAGAAGSAASGVGALLAGILGAFATGGYTGNGHPAEPAGVVHGGEFVLNKAATDHYGVGVLKAMNDRKYSLSSVRKFEASMAKRPTLLNPDLAMAGGSGGLMGAGKAHLQGLTDAVDRLTEAHGQQMLVATTVDEKTVSLISKHPSSPRAMAAMMQANKSVFRPVIKQM